MGKPGCIRAKLVAWNFFRIVASAPGSDLFFLGQKTGGLQRYEEEQTFLFGVRIVEQKATDSHSNPQSSRGAHDRNFRSKM